MSGALGLMVSTIGPFAATWLLLRRTRARDLGRAVCACAAWGLGTGVSSLMWWVLSQIPDVSAATLVYLDSGIWTTAVLLLAIRLPRQKVDPTPPSRRRLTPAGIGAFAVLLLIGGLAAVTFAARSYVTPHGEWDAWAIWNARARALFLRLPPADAHTAPLPVLAHADYPELLPRSIARAWTFAGVDDVSVPIALAAMFAGFAALLAGASIRQRSNVTLGLLTTAFILASPALVNWTWSQGADVPLSFYILLTFVFAASAVTSSSAALWVFAGLSAGLAAWTKNEGVIFVLVAALVVAWWTKPAFAKATAGKRFRLPLAAFAAGAAPSLLVLIAFKLNATVGNDVIAAQSLDRMSAVFTWHRFAMIGAAIGRELWFGGATTIGPLPVLALFVAVNGSPRWLPEARLALLALAITLAAYWLVYVITPYDLAWHLRSSLDRLILQLTPSIVWAGMLVTGSGFNDDIAGRVRLAGQD